MKKYYASIALLGFLLTFFSIQKSYAQFTLANDDASQGAYSGGFGDGNDGGSGFNAWSISYGSNTGTYLGNPSNDGMGTTGIGTTAWAFYATGADYLNAVRSMSTGLEINDELSFYWAMNYDANGGGKGFDFKKSDGTNVFNVNNSGSQVISTTNDGTAESSYGTDPMLVRLKRTSGSTYSFSFTPRNSGDGTYSTTINSSDQIDRINIYIGNQNDGSGQRNIYFNQLSVTNDGSFNISTNETYTKNLTGTGSVTKLGTGILTLTGTNNYSGTTTVSGGTLKLQSDLANSDVTVQSGTTLEIDGDVILKSLTVSNGTVKINEGKSLTITNDLNNTGTITLHSDSSTYSSLIVNGSITANGTVAYSRYTAQLGPSGTNDLISPPVSGQAFGTFAAANSNLATSGTTAAFAVFNNTSGNYENYDTSGNSATTLDAGTGYRAATTDGSPLTFTGTVETGAVNVGITEGTSSIWNLIGNPYTSYIDLGDFLSANAATTVINGSYYGVYGYDGNASDGWTIWDLNVDQDNLIAPGQGFFVAAPTGGSTVGFTTAMRRIGSSDDFISGRIASPTDDNFAHAILNLDTASSSYNTNIYFRDSNTRGLDPGYDTGAYDGSANGIYTHLVEDNQGVAMANQSLPYSDLDDIVVPLVVNADQGVQLSFSLDGASEMPAGIYVYLEDNLTDTWTLLNTNDYTMTPTTALSGAGRFYIHFSSTTLSNGDSTLSSLQIYTQSKSIIVNGQLQNNTTLSLYDIQGRLVLQQVLDSGSTHNQVSVNSLNTGVYIVQLHDNSQNRTQKVVID